MPVIKEKEDEWNNCIKINDDPYGKYCVDVAREVMRLLDTAEYQDIDTNKIICDAETNIGKDIKTQESEGVTGFMVGCIDQEVVQMVSRCHSRGEEFRRKWNNGKRR